MGSRNDVDNGTGTLGDHGVYRPAGGLKQTFTQDLHKNAQREDTANAGVGNTALHGFCHIGLHFVVGPGTEKAEEHEDSFSNQRQEDTVACGSVGLVPVPFAQRFGQQGVDTHTDANGKADLHILHRECQRKSGHRTFRHPGNVNTVHHIVECLNQHGDDHGDRHIQK